MISILDTGEEKPTERRLPAPDRFASCPDEGNILAFYDGQFEAVYILLHPFIRCISIDKERFWPETYPSKTEILEGCIPVEWSEVVSVTGLASIGEIDIGLRSGIGGLRAEFSNEKFADAIDELEKDNNIVRPCEGEIPELIQNRMFEAFQGIGQSWLWLGDEFGMERKLEWIDDLKGDFNFPPHGNIFTPDKSILVTTHWDSHFSFLCSTQETIEKILKITPFEGFFVMRQQKSIGVFKNERMADVRNIIRLIGCDM